ncbi:MAG: PBP1A family penicillin-binding protein [Pseudomonadota bacterium]
MMGALLKRIPGRVWRYVAYAFVALSATAIAAGFVFWQSLYFGMPALPDNETLWSKGREQAYEFRDRNEDLITVRGPHYGRVVEISELAPHVTQAFIAAEDKRFYEHDGADTSAMVRAAWANWRSGRTVSGASTITQQIIKNLVLDSRQTLKRKVQEIRLARQLERRMTKDEILSLYLNRIYFGSRAYGIDAAADVYFDKAPTELTVGESALLATLPKAPSRLALDDNLDGAKARQIYVLEQMVDAGYLTPAQKETAIAEDVTLADTEAPVSEFGHILDLVTDRLGDMLPDAPGDLVITLTVDREIQAEVHTALVQHISDQGEKLDVTEGAALIMSLDGAIRAMVGGTDYTLSQFNRATQAKRQPGSAFKPFVFATAMQAGLDPFSVYQDVPTRFDDWEPRNYADGYVGPVTVAEAFAKSLNTVAAQIGHDIGEERIISTARAFGILSELQPLPSIALGSQEVSLYELTRAYGVFAKMGERVDPYLILSVTDSRGQLLYERPTYDPVRVYPANLARDMNSLLARVVQAGTGAKAAIRGWTAVGKTGTSQDWRDAWFIGFTSELLGGVWVGNDDDSPMNKVSGGGLPAEIWSDVMAIALKDAKPSRLAGAERLFIPSAAAEERITFYRNLAGAFGEIAPHDVTVAEPTSAPASQR